MIDVVYVLGKGSQWGDNEIRYSLRSLCKHTKHRNVYVVGEKPSFLTNIIHIPISDTNRKELSIMRKILAVCEEEDLSQEFLFMNDDHFFVKDVDIEKYPFYHQDDLNVEIQKRLRSPYRTEIEMTYAFLKKGKYYDIHTPIRYDKTKFPEIMTQCPWDRHEMVIKSLYANMAGVQGTYRRDIKMLTPDFRQIKTDTDVYSVSPRCNFRLLKRRWEQDYPEKCRYEK